MQIRRKAIKGNWRKRKNSEIKARRKRIHGSDDERNHRRDHLDE
jgi:hypothetical protein